jgi:hypothetical protein
MLGLLLAAGGVSGAAAVAAHGWGPAGVALAVVAAGACFAYLVLQVQEIARSVARAAAASDDARHAAEERHRAVLEAIPLPLMFSDDEGRLVGVNEAAVTTYGYSRAELLLLTLDDLRVRRPGTLDTPQPSGATLHRKKDGSELCVESWSLPVSLGALGTLGGDARTLTVTRDVTERVSLEAQLRHAQKMESIGRLAGGVAHDFNNLLSVIMSYTELSLEADLSDEVHKDLTHVRDAAERARDLTRQLLAFSRRQPLRPRRVDISKAISNMEKVIRRVLGEDIELVLVATASAGHAEVDPAQLEQVVLNLVVNARDAMPHGGTLTIETSALDLAEGEARKHFAGRPGAYVAIRVQDTGIGMDRATRARIFEPFFTTKGTGKGTGLGLSTVFGIVKQSGGHISVDSEPKNGSSFWVYLPRVAMGQEPAEAALPTPPRARGGERILLVEDQDDLRELLRVVLEKGGYHVLSAADADEALHLAAEHAGSIELLLTDVIMPRMNGRALAERLVAQRPQTAVLYMSGYAGDVLSQHGLANGELPLLEKPIVPGTLLRSVREAIDAGPRATPKGVPATLPAAPTA